MRSKLVTQSEFIEHYTKLVEITRKRIVDEFGKLDYNAMERLKNTISDANGKIGFAKSGKMTTYSIWVS